MISYSCHSDNNKELKGRTVNENENKQVGIKANDNKEN